MNITSELSAALLIAALLGACKDDEVLPDPTPEPPGNTVVTISMHYFFGANAFDTLATYTDDFSTELRIERIRWYMAQPFFINDAADTVESFPDKYLLIDTREGSEVMTIGELSGHLHEMHFGIGVNSEVNHADPDTMPEPLNDLAMHTGDQGEGYKFLVVEGQYDSDADGAVDAPFLYQCSSDGLFTEAEVHTHEDADQGGNLILDLDLDVEILINGIDVFTTPTVTTANATTQALMTNLSTSITYP